MGTEFICRLRAGGKMGWRRILFTMCSVAPCCNKGIQTTVLRCLSSVLASQGTNECLGDAFTCQASV